MFLINGHKQESLAVSNGDAPDFSDGSLHGQKVVSTGKVSCLSACRRLQILVQAVNNFLISGHHFKQRWIRCAAEQRNRVVSKVCVDELAVVAGEGTAH